MRAYRERMKIEESFRDLKRSLGMANLMSKTRANAEKTPRLLAFACALGLLVGETLRERWQGEKEGFRSQWREALREVTPKGDPDRCTGYHPASSLRN